MPKTPRDNDIEIKDISKNFGKFAALKDVSLSVKQGERVVVCGPSGSGKSTLIRCINGLEIHDAGSITVDGIILNHKTKSLEQIRSRVGMVFQQFNLFPHLTVLENITLGPVRAKKVTRQEADSRAMGYLERVKIPEQAHKYPGQLSGGQQQRIALARALVFEPELVLMDEPLGALDKQLREKMQFEITDLAHRLGITVVYVTHDQTEALTMSDRVAVFDDGRIQQLAKPDQLYEEPENSFVAQFIGENNTMEGTVKEIKDGLAMVELEGGEVIACKPVNVSKPGERTRVSIRPERVEYNKDRIHDNAQKLKAEVLEFIYMGDIFAPVFALPAMMNLSLKHEMRPTKRA